MGQNYNIDELLYIIGKLFVNLQQYEKVIKQYQESLKIKQEELDTLRKKSAQAVLKDVGNVSGS